MGFTDLSDIIKSSIAASASLARHPALRALLIAASTLFATGCGASQGDMARAVYNFPSRDTLATIAQAPVTKIPPSSVTPAERWTVEMPASATDEPSSPLDPIKSEVAAEQKGRLRFTKELACAARELGRFYLEKSGFPDERLRRFITARCGATVPDISMSTQTVEVPASVPDAEVVAKWRGDVKKLLVGSTGSERTVAGVWYGRREGRAVVMLAYGPDEADIETAGLDDTSTEVIVRGVLHRPAERLRGLINQGEHGVVACKRDWSLDLPRFAFRCGLAAEDKAAWFELSAQEQGRVLGRSVALVLVRRNDEVAREYVQTTRAPVPVTGDGQFAPAVLAAVNQARAAAGMKPVRLAAEQSRMSDKLAPHFFGADAQGDAKVSEQIALGLLAGWDVRGGVIQEGLFFGGLLAKTQNASEWIEFALERPIGRFVLLRQDAREVAIGSAPPATVDGLGALVTTYSFFESADHRDEQLRLLGRLRDQRAARKLPPSKFISDLTHLAREARLVNLGQKTVGEALQDALAAESEAMGRSVRGFAFEGTNLETIKFPDELLKNEPLFVGVEITHHRAPGAAWGQYVVFVLMVDEAIAANVASGKAPGRL
jgi:hypothetical protein